MGAAQISTNVITFDYIVGCAGADKHANKIARNDIPRSGRRSADDDVISGPLDHYTCGLISASMHPVRTRSDKVTNDFGAAAAGNPDAALSVKEFWPRLLDF